LISNHFDESVSGPEKAGVGGSIPSLATIRINNLAIAKNVKNLHSAYIGLPYFHFWRRSFKITPTGEGRCACLSASPLGAAIRSSRDWIMDRAHNSQ